MKKKAIVIGGGAAGFFAAINMAASNSDLEVVLLEKSKKLLSKVKVSGGGRCNVTHACFDPRELVHFYPRGKKELMSVFHRFAPGDTIAWFSERGVELKVEEDGRMFPTTDNSQTIIDCFIDEAAKYKAKVLTGVEVESMAKEGTTYRLKSTNGKEWQADYVIFALGGSHKMKAYQLIEKLGHSIVPTVPSLFTFNLPKHPSNQLMGLSYPATVKISGTNYEEAGALLFTHWGMSGPAILKLSSQAAVYLNHKNYQFSFEVSWLDQASAFIEEQRKVHASKQLKNAKIEDMPQRFWLYLLDRAKVDAQMNWADLSKKQMEQLQEVMSKDSYQANGKTTFKEEFVSCGGVELKEVDFKSMQSKLHPNVYFCGEVLNIDALTGGFNFQAAWSTAYLAAQSVLELDV
jgi:predicted Rossmann fold flavoprotein